MFSQEEVLNWPKELKPSHLVSPNSLFGVIIRDSKKWNLLKKRIPKYITKGWGRVKKLTLSVFQKNNNFSKIQSLLGGLN
jgi:hypothetical protein